MLARLRSALRTPFDSSHLRMARLICSWIPAIEKMISEGEGFVAVGAAHLIGAGSVVELLQKKGYSVTRVGS